MDNRIYVVGQTSPNCEHGIVWSVVGVYDSEDKALEACGDNIDYFIGPLEINRTMHETCEWEGAYYPNAEEE